MVKKIFFYLDWLYRCKVKNERIPLSAALVITDLCNLHCSHCSVAHLGYEKQSYKDVISTLENIYQKGIRIIILTGGEPFLWSDAEHQLNDVIAFAKKKGFFRVLMCTNGTFPLESKADSLWVSLDGSSAEHDSIRGSVYDKILDNIQSSSHKQIYINYTVSTLNCHNLEASVNAMLRIKGIKGVFFHLFIPYVGADASLALKDGQRENVVKTLFRLKKKHPFKIVNTFDALKCLLRNSWERPLWSSITISQGEENICCCRKGLHDEETCKQCGGGPATESFVLQAVKPLAILENLRFL